METEFLTTETLYSDIRKKCFALREEGKIPKTLAFINQSAFCYNVDDSIFNNLIPSIDSRLAKGIDNLTRFEKQEISRFKQRLIDMLNAMNNESNCNMEQSDWVYRDKSN